MAAAVHPLFPPLYAIVDREALESRGIGVLTFAEELRDAGVRLLQYRDKKNGPREIIRTARGIADVFAGVEATFILNDRVDLAALLRWGVHVGQGDLPIEPARRVLGANAVIGLSTHSDEQVRAAASSSATYIACGPVFATTTKLDAEAVVGLEGVQRARSLTEKPLVGIGGISWKNASEVRNAGADSLAVVSALIPGSENVRIADLVRRLLPQR